MRLSRPVRLPPPAVLGLAYLGFILAGAGLLKLPMAATGPVTAMEALFTSTSAVTVTGLVLLQTGQDFTLFGQIVIAVLIQLGGLGLVAFAALVMEALGIAIGPGGNAVLREDLNQTSMVGLARMVKMVFGVALAAEAAGAVLLTVVFVPDLGWGPGLWAAVFHSVSAFNNAGFALWPDSLSRWAGHPVIALGVPAMFLLGGLGFVVLDDIARRRAFRKLSLHSKLMLAGTLILSAWGIVTFAALEWSNPGTLGPLSGWGKVAASVFQGLTPRTAGFNTVEIGATHDSTTLMLILLMMIGGGSASTAGGVKVTTAIVLVLATIAYFRRRSSLHAFGRSLGMEEVMKVMALTTVSVALVMLGIFLCSLSHDGAFLDLAFEVASAFGTVGLSRGATGELDTLGRCVIMAMMFFGRIGPLSLGFFLATKTRPRVAYPAGQVYLG
ncbi:potassium transporter TrkG [Psychromarinibacter sp. C21-152]|uniref:Potassium transporter TrkG n=1 Tax=Psychromarinibacter sediminicola TaxID=3033385 RepID=A0AAE3NP28_9RHOB|nr:potassium transporter TrkG [Psychromarinibacter sediminicola]MDF0599854.1 potassium transporter TrkG [Psychromarinibacter sediminicola]